MNTKNDINKLSDFEQLFKTYWGYVHAICHRYVSNADTAKDMVQEIFITLWKREQLFDNEEGLKKYLARAARYQVFKHLRDNRTTSLEEAGIGEDTLSASSPTPFHHYLYKDLSSQLNQKVDQLKEPSRTIFLMSRYEMLTHKEIAARMGIAVKTVEYHLAKALKTLRKTWCKTNSIPS